MINYAQEVVVWMKTWIAYLQNVTFFAKCDFFCKIWYLVSHWLGFVIVTKGTMSDHLAHFGGLGGFSKHVRLALNII